MSAPVGNEWSHSFLVGTFFWKQKQACLSPTKSFQRPGDAGARRGASTDLQAPPGPRPVKRLRAGSSPPKPGMNHLNLTEAFGHGISFIHMKKFAGNQQSRAVVGPVKILFSSHFLGNRTPLTTSSPATPMMPVT